MQCRHSHPDVPVLTLKTLPTVLNQRWRSSIPWLIQSQGAAASSPSSSEPSNFEGPSLFHRHSLGAAIVISTSLNHRPDPVSSAHVSLSIQRDPNSQIQHLVASASPRLRQPRIPPTRSQVIAEPIGDDLSHPPYRRSRRCSRPTITRSPHLILSSTHSRSSETCTLPISTKCRRSSAITCSFGGCRWHISSTNQTIAPIGHERPLRRSDQRMTRQTLGELASSRPLRWRCHHCWTARVATNWDRLWSPPTPLS